MKDFLAQVWEMLIGRWDGPLALRFLLQPTVGVVLGIRAGFRDARAGRPPYGLHIVIVRAPGHRRLLLLEGWGNIAKLFVAATIIDVVDQLIVYRWIYPGQALIVAAFIVMPTYIPVRSVTNRIVQGIGTRTGVSLNPKGTPGDGK